MFRKNGYTVIELMLTIAILAIIASVAMPPLTDFINRYRSEVVRQRLFDLIALSRSRAYGHGKIYTLCASSDSNLCGTDWSQGALLFEDRDGNGDRGTGEIIERVMQPLPDEGSLEWNNNRDYLQFRPNGLTRWQMGNFTYCPPDGDEKYGWIIILNATGRPYFGRDNDGDGIMENGSGEELDCTAAE